MARDFINSNRSEPTQRDTLYGVKVIKNGDSLKNNYLFELVVTMAQPERTGICHA
jgi:hypothetical protein